MKSGRVWRVVGGYAYEEVLLWVDGVPVWIGRRNDVGVAAGARQGRKRQ